MEPRERAGLGRAREGQRVTASDRPALGERSAARRKPGVDAVATLGSGGFVGAETARRLSCDAKVQILYRDEANGVTGTERASRTIPPGLRRAIEERDGGRCTFPGCERDHYLECHHIIHRAHGGQNVLSNLVLTCWTHHELIHEGGWSLAGEAGPNITWVKPDGTPYEPRARVTLDTS